MRPRRAVLYGSLLLASAVGAIAGVLVANSDHDGDEVIRLDADRPGVDVSIQPSRDLKAARLPEVSLGDVSGGTVALSDLLGTPLVVNFWYSTCPPCRRELPAFAQVEAALGDEVRFVGVNPVDAPAAAERFARSHGMTYANLLDPDGEMLSAIGITVFPTTLLVRADGTIAWQHAGAMTADQLLAAIDENLLAR